MGSTNGMDVGGEKIPGFSNCMNDGGLCQEGESPGGCGMGSSSVLATLSLRRHPCGDG